MTQTTDTSPEAGVGSRITCRDPDDDEILVFVLVDSDPSPRHGRILITSDLGKILKGHREGDEIALGRGRLFVETVETIGVSKF